MLFRKIVYSVLILLAAITFSACNSSTDAAKNNFFKADLTYSDAVSNHYVSDDFNVHFVRVPGAIDTLIVTADEGDDQWIYFAFFIEIDSVHKGDYIVNNAASISHTGVYISHQNLKESSGMFAPPNANAGTITITDVDVTKSAIKGTFSCTLYEGGFIGTKKVDITNGEFSWNY